MKAIGIVRKLDDVGRISIPAEVRKMFNFVYRQELQIYVEGNRIILEKFDREKVDNE